MTMTPKRMSLCMSTQSMEILMNMNKEGEKNLCNVQESAQTLESELSSNSATCLISWETLRKSLSEICSSVNVESTTST